MSNLSLFVNQNVIYSNFVTRYQIDSLSAPYHDDTFEFWLRTCLPLVASCQVTTLDLSVGVTRTLVLVSNHEQPAKRLAPNTDFF
jgi:hypothetical protein